MTRNTDTPPVDDTITDVDGALIVGGSLGGLTTALALADAGIPSTVLERTNGRTQRGVAILVAMSDLGRTVGDRARDVITDELGARAMRQGTYPHAWWDVYTALRRAADAEPLIRIVEDVHVDEVGHHDAQAWARDAAGRTWTAPLLIGADGYRSVTRRHVDASRPDADYAGYVVWLGQSELPERRRNNISGPDFMGGGRRMLAVYPLIQADDSVHSFGWGVFDPTQNGLLRELGALDGARVNYTPRVRDIDDDVYERMARVVEHEWPEPWAGPVAAAFRAREVIATPITEYLPDRVVSGPVALIGDAAHAQTPMTGAGFEEAVTDAEALAHALRDAASPVEGLQRYELARLADMRRRVSGGQSFSRSFAA
ncbi:FAD-dependent monooxygenase [Microbacterium sp. No. 7]|uniref:FAD-dependent monooxygenase n=1 Tax=Microbacterium sp. No. 7 TaxID=1714373 RepID=UPI0006ECF121|nr:NAD(P)/FAD-dependent oxidoreductase [Microbacterium sp. No. 7]ALJ19684.1 hypothetical protein AOA12_07090 [Microbacterium sp. No. 7]